MEIERLFSPSEHSEQRIYCRSEHQKENKQKLLRFYCPVNSDCLETEHKVRALKKIVSFHLSSSWLYPVRKAFAILKYFAVFLDNMGLRVRVTY